MKYSLLRNFFSNSRQTVSGVFFIIIFKMNDDRIKYDQFLKRSNLDKCVMQLNECDLLYIYIRAVCILISGGYQNCVGLGQ